MSGERFKKLRKYWWVMVFLVLVASGISTLWIQEMTIPNPNSNLSGRNDPSLTEDVDEGLRIFLSGMSDSLDSDDLGFVEYWVNRSIIGNQTIGFILYFNGNHEYYFNESVPLSDYNNELFWWTGYHYFDPTIFDPFDPINTTTYTIPKQAGGTEIIYQLRLQLWNGSHWIYEKYNMTYTVLFSEEEVQYELSLHSAVYAYIRIDLIVTFFALVIAQPWKVEDTSQLTQATTRGRVYHLSVSNLISRAGHLEGQLTGVRTGASILLAVGSSVFTFVASSFSSVNALSSLSMILGPFCLSVMCFIGIIQSFASLEIKDNRYSLGTSLIPDGMSEYMYKKLLPMAVVRREEILAKTLGTIRIGIIYFFSFMLAGIINLILPNVQNYVDRIELAVPFFVSYLLTAVTVYLLVVTVAKRLKIIDRDF